VYFVEILDDDAEGIKIEGIVDVDEEGDSTG